tara:strand:+ start:24247 stop:24672 length:426 start_codon:yes stop_codon:yes gene_type:complete
MTPQERAEKSAKAMWSNDEASQWIGLHLEDTNEGTAIVSLDVEKHHCNGHGMCHGGIIFALADSAFAFACNSRNQATVAQNNAITYILPGQLGDHLTAKATEVSLSGRNGIYDVFIFNQSNQLIATFRGHSRAIKGQLFQE